MKNIALIIFVLTIASCNSAKETTTVTTKTETITEAKEPTKPNKELIKGTWQLTAIPDIKLTTPAEGNKTIVLRIYPEKKQISGNDGCNNIQGGIKILDEKSITFSQMIGTKMMCPEMKITDIYNKAISQVVAYKVTPNTLSLLGEKDQLLLTYIKKS